MNGAIQSAVSGLLAQTRVVDNAANNIANQQSAGFQPQDITLISSENGQVSAQSTPRDPASQPFYAPQSLLADENGFLNLPNVDTASELVTAQTASQSYKANAAVLRTAQEIQDELLNIFS